MKILYGVQATGNGHISRARAMNKYFDHYGIDVDFYFSGRPRDKFFDMTEFGEWQCAKGLTFVHEAGDLKIFRTARHNSLRQFWKDVKNLPVDEYDAVLTDFEPISAWAAKDSNTPCIGMGHQYAFRHEVPRRGEAFLPKLIMKHFAPADIGLGLHWHHFGQPILPPIAEVHESNEPNDPNKIVVYLGFEEPEDVIQLLEPFENYLFTYYGPFPQYESRGHVQLKPLSRDGFKHDLATSSGVICNAGFELSSEAIQLGKKLLIKPLKGQLEQLSNAKALEELGLGMTMDELDHKTVDRWLTSWEAKQVIYPDVAKGIVEWLSKGDWDNEEARSELIQTMWEQVRAPEVSSFINHPIPIAA